MSTRFDGRAVLGAIAGHPTAFPALKADIDATARKLLLKQLRAASMNLDVFGRVLSAVGEPSVRTAFDEMGMKDLTSVARRLDPANAAMTDMGEMELGNHVCALARGDIKPSAGKKVAARAPAKRPAKELSKIGEVLNSKVHSGETAKPTAKAPKAPVAKRGSTKSPR